MGETRFLRTVENWRRRRSDRRDRAKRCKGRGSEAPGKTVEEEEVSPEARKKKAKTGRKKKQKRVIILLQLHFSLGILVWKKLVAFEYFSPKLQRSFFLAKAI